MDVECEKRDSKTLRNEHGNYPPWMNRRKVRKHKKMLKQKEKNKRKRKRT